MNQTNGIMPALIATGLAGVSCGQNSPPPSSSPPNLTLEEMIQPPETLDAIGTVKSTAVGSSNKLIQKIALTRFDIQLENGLYVAVTPFEVDAERDGFWDGPYHIQGTLKKDDAGKPLLIPSIAGGLQYPLYDLTSMQSTLPFPDRFEIERGAERGLISIYGGGTPEAKMLPGGNPRLVAYISDPGTYVSILSPSVPWNGGFRLIAERTALVDRVGKPVYREVSLTPLPIKEVYIQH